MDSMAENQRIAQMYENDTISCRLEAQPPYPNESSCRLFHPQYGIAGAVFIFLPQTFRVQDPGPLVDDKLV